MFFQIFYYNLVVLIISDLEVLFNFFVIIYMLKYTFPLKQLKNNGLNFFFI